MMQIFTSLTSWTKRIDQAKLTIDSLLKQTRKPDKIYLNLDYDNFPKGMESVSEWVVDYSQKGLIEVKFEAADMKVWQKIMPADMHTGDIISRICMDVPKGIVDESRPSGLSVTWRTGNSHTEAIDLRKRACYRLAEQFVCKVLPKVDFWIRKEINNKEIEDILEVLE